MHAKVTPVPAASHVESCGRIFDCGNFAIKRFNLGLFRHWVHQVYGSRVASLFHIEVSIIQGGSVEYERLDIAERITGGIHRFQCDPVMSRLVNRELTETGLDDLVLAIASDCRLSRLAIDSQF